MSTQTLPAKFLFVRNSELYSYVAAAEIHVTPVAAAYEMTALNQTHQQHYQIPPAVIPFSFFMTATIKKAGGDTVAKRIYKHPIPAKNVTTGEEVPILTFASPSHVFGAYALKLTITLLPSPTPTSVAPTLSVTSPAIAVTALAASLPVVAPATSPTPKPVKKKTTAVGDLNPFVAKQLLELAQTKHEMCPIVAEEFATGHTAVMPCGHLFADFAIKETFKKEPNKCPVCRVYGAPTYI